MIGEFRFYDYRCFRREAPAILRLERGITSFLGPNNSGKSALIRAIYDLRSALGQLVNSPNSGQLAFHVVGPMQDAAEIVCDRANPECAVEMVLPTAELPGAQLSRVRLEFDSTGATFRVRYFSTDEREFGPNYPPNLISSVNGHVVSPMSGPAYSFFDFWNLVDVLNRSMYVGPFRNAINDGAGMHFDTAIGTGFINQWHQWKTGVTLAQNSAIERVTEDIRRLIGAETLEISASVETKSLQININRRPYKLHNLGSGIAQLIVVLGNALVKKPSFIVIDEPEIHLHPGLQNDFITTLSSYSEFGVIFATHSVGLARSVSDYSYTIQKQGDRSVVRETSKTKNYAEFLGSLGIAGLQELGWDRILLVEGPKDVRTFQQFLRRYGLDRRTVVLPLGGDSMVNGKIAAQLEEIVRLAGHANVFAVVDSERKAEEGSPKKERIEFAKVCEELGICCCISKFRAIENYITQDSLNSAFGGRYKALGSCDVPGDEFWGKGDSWRAAIHMSKDDLDRTDIGELLQKMC